MRWNHNWYKLNHAQMSLLHSSLMGPFKSSIKIIVTWPCSSGEWHYILQSRNMFCSAWHACLLSLSLSLSLFIEAVDKGVRHLVVFLFATNWGEYSLKLFFWQVSTGRNVFWLLLLRNESGPPIILFRVEPSDRFSCCVVKHWFGFSVSAQYG